MHASQVLHILIKEVFVLHFQLGKLHFLMLFLICLLHGPVPVVERVHNQFELLLASAVLHFFGYFPLFIVT